LPQSEEPTELHVDVLIIFRGALAPAAERKHNYLKLFNDHMILTYSEIHRFTCSGWNKEELPQLWKESIIVPIYKKGDKSDCNNYQGISLLSTAYKTLSNILLVRLTLYVNEIIYDL
jgi:hypothetical protein